MKPEVTEWSVRLDGETLEARFDGWLTQKQGEASAKAFVAKFDQCTHERLDIVFEVTGMTGYAPAARRAWQRSLLPYRRRIRSITTVGASTVVRMGASTIGLLLRVPVRHLEAAS